jgi:hypothetical protein
MECTGCGSAPVAERSERTAQGYRRFRSRACGKQFNERSAGSLNRTQYPSDVIASWSVLSAFAADGIFQAVLLRASRPARCKMYASGP